MANRLRPTDRYYRDWTACRPHRFKSFSKSFSHNNLFPFSLPYCWSSLFDHLKKFSIQKRYLVFIWPRSHDKRIRQPLQSCLYPAWNWCTANTLFICIRESKLVDHREQTFFLESSLGKHDIMVQSTAENRQHLWKRQAILASFY